MGKIIITNIWGKHKDISVVECIEEKTSKEKIKFFSFINTEDKFINQCRYESVFSFNDGMAKVKMNSCWGVIDKNGVELIPATYKHIYTLHNKLFQVCIDNLWGIINSKNETIVPIIYDYVFPPIQAYIIIKQNGKYGVIDYNGNKHTEAEWNSYNEALNQLKEKFNLI